MIPANLENAIRAVRESRALLVRQYLPNADPSDEEYDRLVAETSVPEHLGELSLSLHAAYSHLLDYADDVAVGYRHGYREGNPARKGGKVKSQAKSEAARANGAKGGRPRKQPEE